MHNRRSILQLLGSLPLASTAAIQPLAAQAPADVTGARFSGFDLLVANVPIDERVRESLVGSFRNQGRMQTHYLSTLFRLKTDVGVTGIGEARMAPEAARSILTRMVGRSPWEYLQDDEIGGILMGVYDVLGRMTGLPAARLLSPSPRPRIVQTWWSQCYPPAQMASEAQLGYTLGYRVHKIKFRPWQDPVEQTAAICDAVPSDFRFWGDANAWWGSVGRTLDICRKLAGFNNLFAIETPFSRKNTAGFRELKNKLPFRLAEHVEQLDDMLFVREGLVDAFVVAAPRMGQTLIRRNALAEASGVPLWVEHSTQTGVAQVFQAHQAAAYKGIEYTISVTHCLEDDLMAEPFTMKGGFYEIPRRPGLGVNLDEAAIEKYRVG